MTQSIHLSIPDVPVSNNVYIRWHWSRRYKYDNTWSWQIRRAMGWPGILDAAPDKASVSIVQHRKRLIDGDNLVVKPLLDALKDWQLIWDDSPDHISLTVRQELTSDVQHTEVHIQVLEGSLVHTPPEGDAA